MAVIHEVLDLLSSLAMLMDEENTALGQTGHHEQLETLVAAKMRLVSGLEALLARLNREQPDWLEQVQVEERQEFRALIESVLTLAKENGIVLQRQIDISNDLIDAIAAEARRLSGSRSTTYTAIGALSKTEGVAPISVDLGY